MHLGASEIQCGCLAKDDTHSLGGERFQPGLSCSPGREVPDLHTIVGGGVGTLADPIHMNYTSVIFIHRQAEPPGVAHNVEILPFVARPSDLG